jgi:iron complex transport system permease protein
MTVTRTTPSQSIPGVGSREMTVKIGNAVAVPVRRRTVVAVLATALVIVVAAAATLTMGRLGIPLGELPAALFGERSGATAFTLERLRGPRLLVTIGIGAAFGVSGTLFQTVTRNPLGSPDVIGLAAGAAAGVALCTLMWPGVVPAPLGALAGAVIAIVVVYLATGRGFTSPARIIIAGIGVSAMAQALMQYVLTVKRRDQANELAGFIAGSVNASNWSDVVVIAVVLAVVVPVAAALSPRLELIELGDPLARSLGVPVNRTRAVAIVVAVVAAAGAVTVSGPIAFVALTAPQIARRITGAPGPSVFASALVGAMIMVIADLIAQQAPWADGLPVGVITAGVGGIYLGYLLIAQWRKGRL